MKAHFETRTQGASCFKLWVNNWIQRAPPHLDELVAHQRVVVVHQAELLVRFVLHEVAEDKKSVAVALAAPRAQRVWNLILLDVAVQIVEFRSKV